MEPSLNDQVKVENTSGSHIWKDVKDLVVKIRDKYYLRTDKALVKVPNKEGKIRFFRNDSPFIVKLHDGQFIHKSNAIRTEDGVYFAKNSEEVVLVNDKPVRKVYTLEYKGKRYLKSDTRFAVCRVTEAVICLEDTDTYVKKCNRSGNFQGYVVATEVGRSIVKATDGNYYSTDACYKVVDPLTGEEQFLSEHDFSRYRPGPDVFFEFQDKTNPQENRLLLRRTYGDWETQFQQMELIPGNPNTRILVHNSKVAYVTECINTFIMPRFLAERDKIRQKLNKNFSDLDKDENTAKNFLILTANFAGKQNIFTPLDYPKIVNSIKGKKTNSYKFTGGLKYSYGVEFETSQGLVPNQTLEALGLMAVGDRSIGAAEYVTSPLCGDGGVEALRGYLKALSDNTLVDDRCGLHVHVGGLTPETGPAFNKEFYKNAINLGCLLEEEIYAAMPPSRTPTLYHCHSIRRFGPITEANYNENMGAFIFGEKEKWVDAKGKVLPKLFKFSDYALGPGRNTRSSVGQWADGRYKWLNLINCFLTRNHKTIEFRIFPGTVTYQKTYGYLLLSLAFTHIVDNMPKLIRKGVTLAEVFEEAFKGYPAVRDFAVDFYEGRKAKFNRTKIYPEADVLTFLK